MIVCSVREAAPGGAVKKKEVVRAVIVRTRSPTCVPMVRISALDENAAVILDAEQNPRGTRIFGPVGRELRDRGFMRIVSLSPEVL